MKRPPAFRPAGPPATCKRCGLSDILDARGICLFCFCQSNARFLAHAAGPPGGGRPEPAEGEPERIARDRGWLPNVSPARAARAEADAAGRARRNRDERMRHAAVPTWARPGAGAAPDDGSPAARPDARQRDFWPVEPGTMASAARLAKQLVGKWLAFQTMHGRPLADIEGDVDAVSARLVGRVRHLDGKAARLAGRSAFRRHRRRVLSGRWRATWTARQAALAKRRTRPRLEACARQDRRIVRMRRRGRSWRAIGAAVGCDERNCRKAPGRLRRLAALRLRERETLRAKARLRFRRRPAKGADCAIRSGTSCTERSGSESGSLAESHLPRARARLADGPFHNCRRAAYGEWARVGLSGDVGDVGESVKRWAARAGVPYDSGIVASAVDAARWLQRRRLRASPPSPDGGPVQPVRAAEGRTEPQPETEGCFRIAGTRIINACPKCGTCHRRIDPCGR